MFYYLKSCEGVGSLLTGLPLPFSCFSFFIPPPTFHKTCLHHCASVTCMESDDNINTGIGRTLYITNLLYQYFLIFYSSGEIVCKLPIQNPLNNVVTMVSWLKSNHTSVSM